MRKSLKKGLAGLTLLVMLVLSVPVSGIITLAEGSAPAAILNKEFDTERISIDSKYANVNVESGAENKTYPDSTDKYAYVRPSATSKVTGAISDGNGGYTALDAYNAIFRMDTVGDWKFTNAQNLDVLQNKDSFLLEVTFPKIETDFAVPVKLRFRYATAMNTETGAPGGTMTAGSDIVTIDVNGNVCFLGTKIANAKTETAHVSLSATYSATDKAYLVNVYVNGNLVLSEAKLTGFGGVVSAQAFHDTAAYGLYCVNINAYQKTYGTTYVDSGATTELGGESVKVYTATKGNYPNPFDANGNSRYSLAIDKVYLRFGTAELHNASNVGKTVLLAANGNEVAGAVAVGNAACLLNYPVSSGETTALPSGYTWYDAASNVITSVPSSLAGTGKIAAYLPVGDKVIAGSDFTSDDRAAVGADTSRFHYDDALGKIRLEGNYKVSDSDHNLDGAGNGKDCNISKQFPDFYTQTKTSAATLTVKMTIGYGSTEMVPSCLLRLRTYNWQGNYNLFVITKEGNISFANGTTYQLTPDADAAMTFKVQVQNKFDGNGNVSGSTMTIDTWCNGVYYGSKSLATTLTLGQGVSGTDLGVVQFQHHGGQITSTPTELYIDDCWITIDTQEDDSAAYGFSSYSGASIRPANDKASAGLRFGFRIDKDYYDALTKDASSVEVGAYIVPEDYLTDGVLDGDVIAALSESKELLKMTVSGFSASSDVSDEDTYGFYASIVNLKEHNYARAFRAIAYITVDGTTVYSTASESRSANEVARKMAESGALDGKYADMKGLITSTYLDTVAVLNSSCELVSVSGYTSPYNVTKTGTETILVRLEAIGEFDINTVKSIVIGDKVYNTSGCFFEPSVLSFTYTLPTP